MTETKNRPPENEETRGPATELDEPQSTPWLHRCDCREATLLRAIMANRIPLPGTPLWTVLNALIQQAAIVRLRQVSYAIAGPPGAGHWHGVAAAPTALELDERRRLTSVIPCHVCGAAVEVQHPITEEQFNDLPDTSWVRCPAHEDVAA